jgi:hypothetical protein
MTISKQVSRKKTKKLSQREQRSYGLSSKIGVGTFDTWLDKEAKSGKVHARVKQKPEGIMPKNLMNEWLSRQPIIKKPERKEVVPVIGSTEEWLTKQVSNRLLSEEMEQEASVMPTK